MRPSDAASAREAVSSMLHFNTESPDMEVWDNLPNWLQERIQEGTNYSSSVLNDMLGGPAAQVSEDEDSDGPF